jgi:hypothetical protein
MPHLNPTFVALLKEAQFTKQLLGAGATEIRRANYASKGTYFQAFVSLSTGLERIGKLCLMLDYYIDTGGQFPDLKYLKKDIGHNLALLEEKAKQVIATRQLPVQAPSTDIHQAIVRLLCRFAEGDRYSNIDLLAGSRRQSDPIADWFNEVDTPIYDLRVTQKKKDRINHNAQVGARLMGEFAFILHTSETGSEITEFEEASRRTGIFEAVAPYRQLYVLQIIRSWCELTRALQYLAMDLGKHDIPFFGEIFGAFENDDSYMRTRKTWDSI